MSPRTKICIGIVIVLLGLGLLLFGVHRNEKEAASPVVERFPQLSGTWFVKYESDPNAYLDVAMLDGSDSGLKSVKADLRGPQRTYKDVELTFNPDDQEWQKVCDFLPEKLPGGIWWISRIKATAGDGSWSEFSAPNPYSGYRFDFFEAGGALEKNRKSEVWIGAFYAREEGDRVYFFETFPLRAGDRIDLVMLIYAAGDPAHWIAISDDPDVEEVHPRLAVPLTPGKTYFIRVLSVCGDTGRYSIRMSDTGFGPAPASGEPAPSQNEPNNNHASASRISSGETQHHSLQTGPDGRPDEDWFVFTVPE